MTPVHIMDTLSGLGVAVGVRDDKLVLTPKSRIPQFLVDQVRQHKSAIMDLVLEAKAGRGSNPSVSISAAENQSLTVSDIQALLGRDITGGFYMPLGEGQPRIPINGRGTTVLEASGLCSADCHHEFDKTNGQEPA